MPKGIVGFIRHYYLFAVAFIAVIASLILQILGFNSALHITLGAVALLETVPLVWGMVKDLRDGTYGIDVLAATAIISAVLFKQYWAAIVIVLMLTGGEALEDYAEHRAETELTALLSKAPKQAHVIKGSKTVDVAASSVKTGDKLSIKPGEIVPVDAVIVEGSASFDESSLTGESLPQEHGVGEQILSGSINQDGAVVVKALRPAAESQYEQIIKLVKAARHSQTPFVRLADRYAIPFTAISFVIAIGAWILGHHAIRFLEVLVVATPCPLILAAPIAVISGMSRAAKYGIIIKNGGALERLAETQTIAFDKTGTLTRGELTVAKVVTFNRFSQNEVLAYAAALEQQSNHILAKAIINEAAEQKIKFKRARNVNEQAGFGLSAVINGKDILVGRATFLKDKGVDIPKSAVAQTVSYVAVEGKLAGAISFKDELRPESQGTLRRLSKLGIKHTLMVTGDNAATAKLIAEELQIEDVTADALPIDKLKSIEEIKNRPAAFVGDGVNDAPVLASADVGIALGARGETAASESADMVIMLDDLSRVATVVAIAKRTFSIAKQSILVGIIMSIGLMLIFATGHFRPLYGAVIQELVDVVVIFNALRAHSGNVAG